MVSVVSRMKSTPVLFEWAGVTGLADRFKAGRTVLPLK